MSNFPTESSEEPSSLGSLHDQATSSLGSLKQHARGKNLRAARIALVLACIIMSLQATVNYTTGDRQIEEFVTKVRQEVKKKGIFATVNEKKVQELKDMLRRVINIFSFGMFGFAAIFLMMALLVYRFPLFCTVGGLVLYIGYHLIIGYLISRENDSFDVMTVMLAWWPIKIIIILGLIKGIQTAVAYQRERAELAAENDLQAQPGV